MTRKDYNAVAAVLKNHQGKTNGPVEFKRRSIGVDLAAVMQADNPRFDRDRFLIAAGIPRDHR